MVLTVVRWRRLAGRPYAASHSAQGQPHFHMNADMLKLKKPDPSPRAIEEMCTSWKDSQSIPMANKYISTLNIIMRKQETTDLHIELSLVLHHELFKVNAVSLAGWAHNTNRQ